MAIRQPVGRGPWAVDRGQSDRQRCRFLGFLLSTVYGLLSTLPVLPPAAAAEEPAKTFPAHPPVASGAQGDGVKRIRDKMHALQAQCDRDPKAWQPRIELGEMYVMFGYPEDAVKLLDEAIALEPGDAREYQLAGEAHRQLKEYDKAVELLGKALKIQPGDKRAEDLLARVRKQRDEDARLAELDAKLAKNPKDPAALSARAQARAGREQWKEALADLDALLAVKADDPDAVDLAALAHFQLGHMDEAIRFWTRAQAAHPDNELYKGWIEKAQSIKKAQDDLAAVEKRLQGQEPADGKLYLEAGELYAKLGRWPKAAQSFAEAVRLLPKDVPAHKSYGVALFRMGKMDEAIREFETCVKLDPKDPENARLLKGFKEMQDMHREMKQSGAPLPKHGTPP